MIKKILKKTTLKYFIILMLIISTYLIVKNYYCIDLISYKNVQDNSISKRVYFQNLNIYEFAKIDNIFCLGKVASISNENGKNSYFVFYNRKFYLIISQLFPIIFTLFFKKFNKYLKILFVLIAEVFGQLVFNYNFGFNMLNSVFVFTTLTLIIYIIYFDEK